MFTRLRSLACTLFFVFGTLSLSAQWVAIPDSNFGTWLKNEYPACLQGSNAVGWQMDTTCNQVINAHGLEFNSANIRSIEGVQYFDNITTLICDYNHLTNLPDLPASLINLYCSQNQLVSLSALPASLIYLECVNNQLSSLPALPSSLINLRCINNQLSSLPTLPSSLVNLECGGNQLGSLPALPSSLVNLVCGGNQLSSLPALPSSLINLSCAINLLSNLPTLPHSLNGLTCNHNQLTSLPVLPSLLTNLICNNNQLSGLPSLPDSLIYLTCNNNQLANLPALSASLRVLVCSSNQLSSLPDLPASLNSLQCNSNQLTSLPELPDSLTFFYCNFNPNLTCLPQLKKVKNLKFNNTGITCLPNYPQSNISSTPALNTVPLCNLYSPTACDVYWNITGKAYYDSISDCISQPTESNFSNIKVNLYNGGSLEQQAVTHYEGSYSFDVGYGTYTYSVDSSNIPFTVSCPAAGFRTSNITALDSMDFSMDFGLRCKQQGFDVGVQSIVASGTFRPASFRAISIDAGDMSNFYGAHCAAGTSGTVQAVLSGPFTYVSNTGGLAPSSVAGNTITWSIGDFGLVNFFTDFAIQVQTDTLAQAGDVVCITVTVTPTAGDNNLTNNTLSHCWTVVNSYDPNIKEVFPTGDIPENTEGLTYTIHFQNTGNAPAEHIYVDDTLDTNLDISSFQLLAYSHQNLTQVFAPEHRVRFNFPNINLPDSTSNEPQSHGYVQYKIKRLPNLAPGTAISNTASIYFDFNPPVVTNTVTNNMCVAAITDVNASTCSNQPYSFNGLQLSQAGDYNDTVKFLNRCDSVTALHLAILNTSSFAFTESICSGSSYNFYGNAISTPGNYTHTLINTNGCDSVITLQLNLLQTNGSTISQSVCDGNSYDFYGTQINTAGTYTHTLQNVNGCDSVLSLTLTVNDNTNATVQVSIQQGQTYILPDGTVVNTAGTYTDTLLNAEGCDSIITTELSVISAVAEVSGQKSDIRLNPNPTQDAFMVSVSDNLIGETLEITDAIGKLVFQSKISHLKSEISASNWCAGVYFVKAGDIVKRLVVE